MIRLELDANTKLDNTGVGGQGRDATKVRAVDIQELSAGRELRVIEHIVQFTAKLDSRVLRYANVLQ